MPKPDPQASQDLAPSGRLRAALNFGNQVLAVRSPSGEAQGVRIAVTRGSAYELFLTRHLKHATLVRVERPEDALKTFLDKGLDALAAVRQPLNGFAASHPGLRVLTDAFMRIEQAVGVPK